MPESAIHRSLMQRALGDDWSQLGTVVRRHYEIVPGVDAERVMEGTMAEVWHAPAAAPLIWAGRLFGALIARTGRDVRVRVRNWTTRASPYMHWHRTFDFPNGSRQVFESRMEHAGGTEIIERVRAGLGIRMHLSVRDGALLYRSRGYHWRLGPLHLRLPDWLLLGHAEIIEAPVSESEFRLDFRIQHPLWGPAFRYSGRFRLPPPARRPSAPSAS